MKPFAHFVLTRFNAPLKPADQSGIPDKPEAAADHRLVRRFDLFERACLTSMERQAESAFQWLVFMDWSTPVAFKERMAALAVRHDFLRPIYVSVFLEETVREEIRRREPPESARITTWLLPDAAFHPRMIGQIQDLAREHLTDPNLPRKFLIRFPIGCCERKGDFYLQRDPLNPFVSFVSPPDSPRTVLSLDTRALPEDLPVLQPRMRPMWCRVLPRDRPDDAIHGIYWPWGGSSEFAPVVTGGFRRSPVWQAAEVLRSAFRSRRRKPE